MKRLLILAMCAALAVPGLNVSAAEQTMQATEIVSEVSENTALAESEKAAANAVEELNDYYIYLEFTNTEKTNANAKMTEAGKKLGYDFDKKSEKLVKSENTEHKLVFHTVEMITDYKNKVKKQLDDCKTKETIQETPPKLQRSKQVMSPREAVFSDSEIISVSSAKGRILASDNVSCPPAIPIVVCGEEIDESAITLFKYYGIEKVEVVK